MAVSFSSPPGRDFEVDVLRAGDAITLVLAGELDLASIDALRERFSEARREAPSRITFDLSELTFIDSTGISFLLSALKEDDDSRLGFIASEAPAVQRVLTITGVAELFGGAPLENPS